MSRRFLATDRMVGPVVFAVIFACHALYVRHTSALPPAGWAEQPSLEGGGWGFEAYLQAQDYYLGFSYALAGSFAAWALTHFVRSRRVESAVGAAGSLTVVGFFLGAGCFLVGCCGSPMLAVYGSLLGVKIAGGGKALMAVVTLLSVLCGCWCLKRRFARGRGVDSCCVPGDVQATGKRKTSTCC